MDSNNFYKKVEQHVTALFADNVNPSLTFHNLEHTKNVVARTKEIAGHYYLAEKDLIAVFVASWFHDTGYLQADAAHHEEQSVVLMKEFMAQHSADEELVQKVETCILATRPPCSHASLPEQIVCDADTFHLGTKEFKDSNKNVWEEYNGTHEKDVSEKEWAVKTLALLNNHRFYTKYCKDLLNKGKKKNMKKIKKIVDEVDADSASLSMNDITKDKSGLTSKGIQTMLRMTSGNHLRLSYMADHKANILISVNAIIISVMLSVLIRKLDEAPYLTIPTIIFLIVAVTTIVLAIIATRPQLGSGNFTQQDLADKKINLLFFGNFHKATYDEYNAAMREMMKDTDYLYGTVIRDIHTLGIVLSKKYKLIRLAYNIFMIGIVVSVIAFAVAFFFFRASNPGVITTGSGSPF